MPDPELNAGSKHLAVVGADPLPALSVGLYVINTADVLYAINMLNSNVYSVYLRETSASAVIHKCALLLF